jgi:hypothetical protein
VRPVDRARALARDRRQRHPILVVGPEAALAGREVAPQAGAGQLQARHRLEVPGNEREPELVATRRQRLEELGHPGRDHAGQVRGAQLGVGLDRGALHVAPPRVGLLPRHPGRDEQVADDRPVGPAGRLDGVGVQRRHAVDGLGRGPQRVGVRLRGALEQRAVDVEEQQERRAQWFRPCVRALSGWSPAPRGQDAARVRGQSHCPDRGRRQAVISTRRAKRV